MAQGTLGQRWQPFPMRLSGEKALTNPWTPLAARGQGLELALRNIFLGSPALHLAHFHFFLARCPSPLSLSLLRYLSFPVLSFLSLDFLCFRFIF